MPHYKMVLNTTHDESPIILNSQDLSMSRTTGGREGLGSSFAVGWSLMTLTTPKPPFLRFSWTNKFLNKPVMTFNWPPRPFDTLSQRFCKLVITFWFNQTMVRCSLTPWSLTVLFHHHLRITCHKLPSLHPDALTPIITVHTYVSEHTPPKRRMSPDMSVLHYSLNNLLMTLQYKVLGVCT